MLKMMECDSTDRVLGFNYEEFGFDDLPRRMQLDYNSLDFVFMNDHSNLNHIFEKKIKADFSNGNESEEVTAIFVDDDDDIISSDVNSHSGSLDLVNGLTSGPELMFDDDLLEMSNSYSQPPSCNTETSSTIDETEVYVQFMNVNEPLNTLRSLLEDRFHVDLSEYEFWLQDSQKLEADKNLTDLIDQSLTGNDGRVQFNVQLKFDAVSGSKKINVLDVLKPAPEEQRSGVQSPMTSVPLDDELLENLGVDDELLPEEKEETSVQWAIDMNYRKDQELLNIPLDPFDWEKAHVRHWLVWAVRQFNLTAITLSDWNMDGLALCRLGRDEFKKKVPNDPHNLFWTHLELLKKCKFVAVTQKDSIKNSHKHVEYNKSKSDVNSNNVIYRKKIPTKGICSINKHKSSIRLSKPKVKNKILQLQDHNSQQCSGNRSGNNGQIQLWQFLLELLTDKHHRQAIQWLGNDGEFKLLNPEMVAHLWGERKNKPAMNYEKLSRALRYYYEGDMISKVHGKRFVYKFVCDLKSLLGYSASELNTRVIEAEKKLTDSKDSNCLLFGSNENEYESLYN